MPKKDLNLKHSSERELIDIADYVLDYQIDSKLAFETARYALFDAMGCAILALNEPACTKLLGPWVPGIPMTVGARVIGTGLLLDPVKAAFDIGTLIRWLDYNDTWLAAEWGHPSDNLGGILSVMDYISRLRLQEGGKPYVVQDLLDAMIRAYEIQGVLALENSFNAIGLDHVILVKVASAAVVTKLLGGTKEEIINALSQAFLDGQSLRAYRHAPNTGSRKSWAAGDATSRAVRLAMMTIQGEMGYPLALFAPKWGFYDVYFHSKPFSVPQPYTTYVMENILFKVKFPAEFHGQTAVDCALFLHKDMPTQVDDIEAIHIYTQNAGMKIINKEGPLHNPADRDHCIQYMVACALIYGELSEYSYSDEYSKDPRIDALRAKMLVKEDPSYSQAYLDPKRRAIPNRVEIKLKNGKTLFHEVLFPMGHPKNRKEGVKALLEKLNNNLNASKLSQDAKQRILELCKTGADLDGMSVTELVDLFCPTR
ncbi:MAG TPA: bifunctional 2-methylcitrate dehydratase/aconitate hydratase [Gammaproteobacteria bacterium]|nr:bifunctional 2-methylcitrate dehydratase/aconitate hydratase [Gammaproteobacteria bacterium]